MLAALDSNILLYAEGFNDVNRCRLAQAHIDALGNERIVLPLQAVGEMVNAQIRVAKRPAHMAAERARDWTLRHKVQNTTREVIDGALEITENHHLQWWDAVILSAASESGASVLLSEDMQSGFRWNDVTIVNPFLLRPPELIVLMSLATRH